MSDTIRWFGKKDHTLTVGGFADREDPAGMILLPDAELTLSDDDLKRLLRNLRRLRDFRAGMRKAKEAASA